MKTKTKTKTYPVPTTGRLLVKPLEAQEKSRGGIIIPDNAKEKPRQAVVLDIGGEFVVEGRTHTTPAEIGDIVIYTSYAGAQIEWEGEELLILSFNDVLAVIEAD